MARAGPLKRRMESQGDSNGPDGTEPERPKAKRRTAKRPQSHDSNKTEIMETEGAEGI